MNKLSFQKFIPKCTVFFFFVVKIEIYKIIIYVYFDIQKILEFKFKWI